MKQLQVTITGTSPLLMHSDRFANPLDPMTKAHKELTSVRKKSDETHEAIAKSEFMASCYWTKQAGFFVPGQNMDACLIGAAKLQKLGVKFKQAVQTLENEMSLVGTLPANPELLWADGDYTDCRGVKVGMAKIMRYRPIFKSWKLKCTIMINDDVLNVSEVKKALVDAGALIGLGDYRPRFGRFSVETKDV